MKRFDARLRVGDAERRTTVTPVADGADVAFDGGAPERMTVERDAQGRLVLRLGERTVRGAAVRDGSKIRVAFDGRLWTFETVAAGRRAGAAGGLGEIRAPMVGKVVQVSAAAGDVVAAGAPLLVLEAMKMEHRLTAPAAARVAEIRVKPGAQVADGDVLAVLEPPPAS